jgi:hypothetical protein
MISPVNIDSILPSRAWLIDKRLRKDVKVIPSKFIKTNSAVEIVQAFIEERVTKTSWKKVSPHPSISRTAYLN